MIYVTPSGKRKILSISASPINSEDGARLGAVCIFHDISDNKNSEIKLQELLKKEIALKQKLMESVGQVKTLIEESPYAVALFDNEGKYLHLNSKLSAFNGLEIDFHLGKTPSMLFGETGIKVEEIIKEVQRTRQSHGDYIIETVTPAHPLEMRTYCLNFYPVKLDERLLGVGFFAEDVTVKKAEENLKEHRYMRTLDEKEQITQFVNVLSHDIRSPLGAIKLNSNLILRNLNDSTKLANYSHKISGLTEKIDNLITDILDVNTLRSGETLELNLTHINLNSLLESVLENYETSFGNIFDLELLSVRSGNWSASGIERIMDNLISNAIKYGHKGSKISISTRDLNHTALFEVTNIGPLIPADMFSQIFVPFRRINGTELNSKSYGLGLPIVKGLVEAHGGSISLQSNEINGTTFSIELPLINE
jgi:signal transduction histidine kinase